jgi:hypothetical protein
MKTVSTTKAAEILGIDPRRMRQLVQAGRVHGAFIVLGDRGPAWRIPLYKGRPRVAPGTRGPAPTYL